jgi:outer membrane protein TolC
VGDGAALLRRRPDVREAERRLAAETARVGVAAADLYPTITLGGSGDYLRNDTIRGSDSFSFAVGPLIRWSFPNVAAARARVRQARAGADAALASFDGTVLTALKETEQALSAYSAEEQRRRDLAEAADRAERAFRLADARYRAGSLAYLDVLVAQQDLLDARAELASSSQRLAAARVNVFRALGGGWGASA